MSNNSKTGEEEGGAKKPPPSIDDERAEDENGTQQTSGESGLALAPSSFEEPKEKTKGENPRRKPKKRAKGENHRRKQKETTKGEDHRRKPREKTKFRIKKMIRCNVRVPVFTTIGYKTLQDLQKNRTDNDVQDMISEDEEDS